MQSEDANIGRVLEGKYEIVRVLGQGGMGVVYEAVHRLINRRLAIKLLHAEYAQDSNLAERFRREAQAASAIGHDHIVDITDMGFTDLGELFIAMEFLDGCDLSSFLEDDVKLPPERACHIMIQVLSALEAAHAKGIIHRDLKPANIFITQNREGYDYVKIVDFGISKIQQEEEDMRRNLTRTGELLGTPAFMSPEQARGESDIGPASDIFSCGLILYRLLTGQTAFDDKVLTMLLLKIIDDTPPRPQELCPEIPLELSEAVMRAIEKKPENRFPDAASFRRVLMRFSPETATQTGLSVTRYTDTAPRFSSWQTGAHPADGGTPISLTATDMKPKSRMSAAYVGVAAALIAAVGLGAFFLLRPASDTSAGPSAADSVSLPTPPAAAPQPTPTPDTESDTGTGEAVVETVKIQVNASPADATVSVDGEVQGKGNVSLTPVRDDKLHRIEVSAEGYVSFQRDVVFDRSVRFTVQLSKAEKTKPKNRPASSSAKGGGKPQGGNDKAETSPTPPPEPEPEPKEEPQQPPIRSIRKIDEVNPW